MAAKPSKAEFRNAEWPSLPLGAILLLALTLLAYSPSLRGFLWDDDVLLTSNPHVKASVPDGLSAIWFSTQQPDYLPLTSSTLWLEWCFWEMNATGYRVTNAVLHTLNALLLWRILRQLKIAGAFLAALIFALHPVCVASVAWIAERKNTLSMLFFLLSIFWFTKASVKEKPARSHFYWVSLAAFLGALLSKGSVVMLPFVLIGLIWWKEKENHQSKLACVLPFFLLSLIFGLITIWFQFQRSIGEQAVNQIGWGEKIVAAFWALGFYLSKAIWPTSLAMVYPPWEFEWNFIFLCVPALVLILGLLFSWRGWRSRAREVFLASAYFVLMLLPVLGFVNMYFLVYSRVADHWQYLALIGVIIPIAAAIQHWAIPSPGQRGVYILLKRFLPVGIVAVLAVLTWQRAALFAQSETLWLDTLAKNPKCWAAHSHLGNALAERGEHDKAIAHFTKALALNPEFADAHFNLANSLAALGETAKAALHFTEAIRCKPRYPEAHYNLGLTLERQGKWDEALHHYRQAIQINPAHVGAHNNAGNLLAHAGQDAEAARHYEQALQWKKNLPEAENNLANVLQRMGKFEEAVSHYLTALELKPDYLDAHQNIALALQNLGRAEEAAVHRAEATRLKSALVK